MNKSIIVPEIKLKAKIKRHIIFVNKRSRNLNLNTKNDFDIFKFLDLSQKQRIKESIYLNKLQSVMIIILRDVLNNFHKKNFSKRYWEIIIGPWLQYFLSTLRNRFRKVKHIIKNEKNYEFYGNALINDSLISQNTSHFLNLHCDDAWNYFIYSSIFNYLNKKKIIKKNFDLRANKYKPFNNNNINLRFVFDIISSFFNKNKKFLIYQSGLSSIEEIKLNLHLSQLPRFYKKKDTNYFEINKKIRNKINSYITKKVSLAKNDFEKYVFKIIAYHLPAFILEGYEDIRKIIYKQKYPKKPRVIFSSNGFDTDELFKFYVAEQVSKKKSPKYIVGQHGNSYNTNINNKYLVELSTCDWFLNWGVKKQKQVKFCNFTSAKYDYSRSNRQYLLIVLRSNGLQYTIWDRELHSELYENQLIEFLDNLNNSIHKYILIKPHKSHYLNKGIYLKIKKRFPYIKFLNQEDKIKKYFNKSKIVIFNYDATSYLELLSSNFPTLAFWPGEDRHVIKEMKKSYKILKKQNLWSSLPKETAKIINENWINFDKFWFKESRQKAISHLQSFICKPRDKNYLEELSFILKKFSY